MAHDAAGGEQSSLQLRAAVAARLEGWAYFLKQLARGLKEMAPAETLRRTVGRAILMGEAQAAAAPPRARRRLLVLSALLLVAGAVAAAATDAVMLGAFVYAPGVALFAFTLGVRWGAVTALIGGALFVLADRLSRSELSETTIVVRGIELVIAGAAIGWLGDRLRRRGDEVARLARDRQHIVAEALKAEDRTRERISQRLHDGALQSLLAARQDIAQAAARPERGELVIRARERTHEAIRELRAAVFELHPVVLELGLAPAVTAVAQQHAQRSDFQIAVDVAPGTDGDPERSRLVLSLVRELVTNIARHADARRAGVSLRRCAGELQLEVWDDGRGIELSRPEQALSDGHIGLASVAQRVEALGGAFDLDSAPGLGTSVRASIPLRPNSRISRVAGRSWKPGCEGQEEGELVRLGS